MKEILELAKWALLVISAKSIYDVVRNETTWQFVKNIISNFSIKMFVTVIVLIFITITVAIMLMMLSPVLSWSWTTAIFGTPTNIAVPITRTGNHLLDLVIYIPFLVMLLMGIPRLAHKEEVVFRANTVTNTQLGLKSLLFGLVHCIAGIPIGAGIALSIGGLLFGIVYRKKYLALLKSRGITTNDGSIFKFGPTEHTESGSITIPLFEYKKTLEDDSAFLRIKQFADIKAANEEALMLSTSYHTMWNSILVIYLIYTFLF